MIPIKDYRDDTNLQGLHAIVGVSDVPGYVREAVIPDPTGGSYADAARQKFPGHTKAAAWLDAAYLLLCLNGYGEREAEVVKTAVDRRAAFWGIEGDVRNLESAFKKAGGAPAGPTQWALTAEVNGQVVRRMPLDTPELTVKSAEWLYVNRASYPHAVRSSAALAILKKAAEWDRRADAGEITYPVSGAPQFETDALQYLERAAGFGFCPAPVAVSEIRKRAGYHADPKCRDAIIGLADAVETKAKAQAGWNPSADDLRKIASMIDEADRTGGVRGRFPELSLPEEDLFLTEKQAAAELDRGLILANGRVWDLAQVAVLPLDAVAAAVGGPFASQVGTACGLAKFAAAARGLSRREADMLDLAMRSAMVEKNANILSDRLTASHDDRMHEDAARKKARMRPDWSGNDFLKSMLAMGDEINPSGNGGWMITGGRLSLDTQAV